MRSNKSKEKITICKLCFRPIEDSIHSILHNKTYLCRYCFNRFNPKLEQFDIDGTKGFYLFPYDQTVQELLYQFKGCFDIELSHIFLDYFRNYLKLKYWGFTVIPAPSSKEGDEKRGFNHVVEMFSCLKLPMLKCVHKTKDVKQADLTSKERQEVAKILEIDNVDLSRKKILIVDDVYTTGSTVRAMINLVQSKHPKRVEVLVMSKTMDLNDQNRPN